MKGFENKSRQVKASQDGRREEASEQSWEGAYLIVRGTHSWNWSPTADGDFSFASDFVNWIGYLSEHT